MPDQISSPDHIVEPVPGLLTIAEQQISSSLTGLLVAAVPLIQALFSRVLGMADRIDGRRLVGLLVGFAGVAALVGIDLRGGSLLAAGEVLLAAACYASGPLVATLKLSHLPSLAVSAVAMGLSALAYAPFAVGSLGGVSDVRAPAWVAVAAFAGSAIAHAKDLKGRLMLYYGTADNNVHPSNMMQLVAALPSTS